MTSPGVRRRATAQGASVRDALGRSGGFRSAQDVYATLRSDGLAIGLSTVYRHLQTLAESGAADVVRSADGEATYRLCDDTTAAHHHHLVCRVCGRAEQVQARAVERWASEVAAKFGYTDIDHTVEVFGRCADCASR